MAVAITTEQHGRSSWPQLLGLRVLRILAYASLGLLGGFLVFAHCVNLRPLNRDLQADAIVVLTGDEDRISEAVKLLAEGRAGRLLISGVNKSTRTPEIIQLNNGAKDASLFSCCVDLDKRSQNTEDNALETTYWVRKRGYRSIILVTSTYHMPRAMLELRQAMPGVDIVPYGVRSPRLERKWWGDTRTMRVLFKEYMKFVTAAVRYGANLLTRTPPPRDFASRIINARLD